MVYPPALPPATRSDTTVAAGAHADDHNKIALALAAFLDELGPDLAGSYANLTTRLLGVAAGQDQAAIDAFLANRTAAEAARAAAEALVLSDLGTTDGQTRALVQNPASQTALALSASTADALADPESLPGQAARTLVDATTYDNRASRSSRSRIVGVGDSISDGTWQDDLQALLDGVSVFDQGFSGEESSRIAFRQGGVTYASTGAVTIPATTTPVNVPVQASITPHRVAGHGSNAPAAAVFAGVVGTVTSQDGSENPWGTQDAAAGTGTVRFTRTAAGSSVSAPAGSLMRGTDGDGYRGDTAVFWTGQNDGAFAGELAPALVVANTQAMIDHLSPDVADFIVLTITTGSTLSLRPAFMAINAALQPAFPTQLRDVRRHLIDNGLSILGITPTSGDTAAIANDIIPPSLLIDGVHPTPVCQAQVVAPFIRDALATKGKASAAPEPEWEPLALSNGSTTGVLKASASNNQGFLRGHVLDGSLGEGTTLAVLPPSARPSEEINKQISWRHQDFTWRTSNMTIYPGGAVVVGYGIDNPLAFPIELEWPLW